jgi:hypothetical protein
MRRARLLVPVLTAALVLSSVPASAGRSIVVDEDYASGREAPVRATGWTRHWRRIEFTVNEWPHARVIVEGSITCRRRDFYRQFGWSHPRGERTWVYRVPRGKGRCYEEMTAVLDEGHGRVGAIIRASKPY